MDLKIIKEKENGMLERKELDLRAAHATEATPSREALKELVSKLVSIDKDYIEVHSIRSERGESASKIRAYIWKEKKVSEETKIEEKKEDAPAA